MKKSALAHLAAVASVSLLLSAQGAFAAGTEEVRARAYFNAIAGGNADTIASFYAEKAEFHWVGGPLAGIYKGKSQIKDVWQKFSQAAGDMKHQVLDISESQNGKVSTVTARVKFIGPKEVPVKFVLMYENGKITNEIWQVDKGDSPAYAQADQDAADKAASAAAAAAEAKIAAATQAPVEQPAAPAEQAAEARPADAATPPLPDRNAAQKPAPVIATITTSPPPPASAPLATPTSDSEVNTPPAPEKRTPGYLPPDTRSAATVTPDKKSGDAPAPRKKVAQAKKTEKKDYGRDYAEDYDDDYYDDYRPRRYYYGYRPYYYPPYGYGYYGLGFRLGYGYRYGRY